MVDVLLQELEMRWHKIFSSLAEGDDVPPALHLRTEGIMQASMLLGLSDAGQLQDAMGTQYAAAMGRTLREDFGKDWNVLFPFPQIPVPAQRAPVYPTTRE